MMIMKRALSFGSVAEDYERYRPGYDRSLVDLIMNAAGQPPRTALEIGAGTGKATRTIAGAGVPVTAIEPDPAMLQILRRECADLPVTSYRSTFEDLRVDDLGSFDLLYAAAALHWTDPQSRWDRVTALLRPGGLVASFGGPTEPADPELAAIEDEITGPVLASVAPPGPTQKVAGMEWPGHELVADERFADVLEHRLPRRIDYTREDYIGLLNTVSAFRQLDDDVRDEVFDELRRRLPGRLTVQADLMVHTARRV